MSETPSNTRFGASIVKSSRTVHSTSPPAVVEYHTARVFAYLYTTSWGFLVFLSGCYRCVFVEATGIATTAYADDLSSPSPPSSVLKYAAVRSPASNPLSAAASAGVP